MPKRAPHPSPTGVQQAAAPGHPPIRRRGTPLPTGPAAPVDATPPPPANPPDEPDPRPNHRTIHSTRFGTLDIPVEAILSFPVGLPGFPTSTAFVLLEHRPGSRFRWLQCVDRPEVVFVVIDPLLVDPEYPADQVRPALAFCELDADEDVAVLVICSIPAPPTEATVNLLAPIGIGLRSRRGAQIVIHERGFDVRTPLLTG